MDWERNVPRVLLVIYTNCRETFPFVENLSGSAPRISKLVSVMPAILCFVGINALVGYLKLLSRSVPAVHVWHPESA